MKNDNAMDIDYVARLARVALSDEEKATFAKQLGDVLGYFEKLKEVDVAGVEPSAHPYEVSNVWRADEPGEAFAVDEALANAPARREGQIVVPKVVEDA
ncbi:MAG: Asp-tRNA(Asn)/Glu-tRNA(Gln) amidotransferase subunit GatC [Opitutales bacterium]|nr:Asp-tRNA(Asn)/Glu-tRNA(Gln) amidotransferase subunit GatC [Opitutales bacterium]